MTLTILPISSYNTHTLHTDTDYILLPRVYTHMLVTCILHALPKANGWFTQVRMSSLHARAHYTANIIRVSLDG